MRSPEINADCFGRPKRINRVVDVVVQVYIIKTNKKFRSFVNPLRL